MKRKAGTLLMLLGAVLVGLALFLFWDNQQEAENAQMVSQEAVDLIWPVIEQRAKDRVNPDSDAIASQGEAQTEAPIFGEDSFVPGGGMTVVEIGGRKYVGVLYIKALGLELPVLADLNDEALEIAPCRYSGTVSTEDLVIGAHNFISHFAKIWRLQGGSEIVFTDMDGHTYYYELAVVETLSPTSNEYLVAGEYPLTLFTCTYGGKERYAVRFKEA